MRGPVLSTGCAWSTVVSSTGAERPALSAGAARLSGRAVFRTAAVFGVAATTSFFFREQISFRRCFHIFVYSFQSFFTVFRRETNSCVRTHPHSTSFYVASVWFLRAPKVPAWYVLLVDQTSPAPRVSAKDWNGLACRSISKVGLIWWYLCV